MHGPELEGFEFRLESDPDLAAEVEKQRQAMLAAEAYFEEKMMKEMMAKGRQMLNEQKHRPASQEEITEKVVPLNPDKKTRRRLYWLSAAASALIVLSVAGWQFGWFDINRTDPSAVVNSYYELEGITGTGLLSGNTEEKTLQQAIDAFEGQDYQQALLGFNDLLSDPSFSQKPRAALLAGIALTQIGETEQAIRRFGEIPASARTYYLEAQWQTAYTLWKGGEEATALETWSSIAENPSHPRQKEAQAILSKMKNL